MRKKHGSFLSSSQTGSGHINSTTTSVTNVQLLHIQTSSGNTTPDHSVTDVVVHSSETHQSDTHPSDTQLKDNLDKKEKREDVHGEACSNDDKNTENASQPPSHIIRLHSELHRKEGVALTERTASLPNLADNQKEEDDEEVKVDVGYMYDLAFKRQESSL